MSLSTTKMIKILWNRLVGGKSFTREDLSLDEEPFEGYRNVLFEDVWIDDIPTDNPLKSHEEYNGSGSVYPSSGQAIVKKWHKLQLKPVTDSKTIKSFYYSEDWGDIIPSEYGNGSYQWELWKKDADGNYTVKVPFGLNDWYFDPVNGVLTFLGDIPSGIDTRSNYPAITVYQYVGRTGSEDVLGTGNISNQADDVTIGVTSDNTFEVKEKYKNATYVVDKLDSNANVTANSFTLNHGLSTEYVDVEIFKFDGSKRVKILTAYESLNNSEVKIYFSPDARAGDFGAIVTGKYTS